MAQGHSQFIGAAGQYFVAYSLAVRQMHAAVTLGNAPTVDVIAAKDDGSRALSIQVKTARNAARTGYGTDGYNWDVGGNAVGKFSEALWYAFVDLKESEAGCSPDIYFVPSRWVGTFVEADFSRKIFFLSQTVADKVRNRWELVRRYLDGETEVASWANALDPDFVWWGTKDGRTSAELEAIIRDGTRWDATRSMILQ